MRSPAPRLAAFLIAGFWCGLTTCSSFMNEGAQFLTGGRFTEGLLYAALELILGLSAVILGTFLGRHLLS